MLAPKGVLSTCVRRTATENLEMTDKDPETPDIAGYLASCLSVYKREHEDSYASPTTPEEEGLRQAIDNLEGLALQIVTQGVVPDHSSRGNKSLREWFQTSYCTQRDMPINRGTIAEPVRRYLRSAR